MDQYIEVIDTTTKNVEQMKSLNMADMQNLISPQNAQMIATKYSDYELTDKDKEKLKKSCDKLMEVIYDKIVEYGGLSPEIKDQMESQKDLVISAVNKMIDNAKTLGDVDKAS